MTERPMPTEEGILAFLKRCEDFYPADAVSADIAQQRRWYDALCAAFAMPAPAGMAKEDALVAGRIPVRRYRPAAAGARARILYIHGGGFVVGSLDSHDAICAELADAAGAELVSVDYRLSPEHAWPAAFDDCWAVLAKSKKPVLGHLWLNHICDAEVAYNNTTTYTGYQPAQKSFSADELIKAGILPEQLKNIILTEEDVGAGSLQYCALTPKGQGMWQDAYAKFNSGS